MILAMPNLVLPINLYIGPVHLEKFRWFGGMLEEFVREKYYSG